MIPGSLSFTDTVRQAVIRLSKEYLPGMAEGFKHPKAKVHVGDGFKFLDDYKNTFDVIITDSSDPEGPAESLFQKPYFQLLHDALRDGGVITTQGCTFPFKRPPPPAPCPWRDAHVGPYSVFWPSSSMSHGAPTPLDYPRDRTDEEEKDPNRLRF